MSKSSQQLMLKFYEQLLLVYPELSETEKSDLEAFEKKRPTSEWPGWSKRIARPA
jgi:hypothetical protein